MANGNFPFLPRDPEDVTLRPLNQGVRLDLPAQGLPVGAFLEAQNLLVNPTGLLRRPVYLSYASGKSVDWPPVEGLQVFWTTAGLEKGIVLDSKFIYEATLAGYTGKYWTYTTGSCSVSGTTVTGSGTAWNTAANEIEVGDIIVIDADASGDGPEHREITAIGGDTTLTIASALTGTYGEGTDYAIRRAFKPSSPFTVDAVVVPGTANKMLFADGTRFLYYYDGATFGDFNTNVAYLPKCVTYFQNRVWIGNLAEGASTYQQRIRWSNVFPSVDTFTAADYQDLPYQQGELMRLVPMGVYLIAYYYDRVFIGRRANTTNPLQFDPIETGHLGLVSTKGVIPWINGHFFVAQDNIYWLSPDGINPEGIATAIIKESLKRCGDTPWRVRAVHWPQMSSLLFAFPRGEETFETVWAFNYKSKSWSEVPVTGEALSVTRFTGSYTYSTWIDYAPYSTGTLAGTKDGSQVTLTGGNFTTGPGWTVAAGDYLHVIDAAGNGDEEVDTYVVVSKDDATHITVSGTFPENFTGKSYSLVEKGSTYSSLSKYESYSAISPGQRVENLLYIAREGELYYFAPDANADYGGTGPLVSLMTGDLDLNLPDLKKVWTRLSLKLEEPLKEDETARFDVYVSVNRGKTWKNIGPMFIQEEEDETFLTFRTVGALARFRIVSGSQVTPYTINEIVLRARPMGPEVPRRAA